MKNLSGRRFANHSSGKLRNQTAKHLRPCLCSSQARIPYLAIMEVVKTIAVGVPNGNGLCRVPVTNARNANATTAMRRVNLNRSLLLTGRYPPTRISPTVNIAVQAMHEKTTIPNPKVDIDTSYLSMLLG